MVALRLNLFQRLLRQWESLHPYNAAQALVVRADISRQQAHDALEGAFRSLGLGPLLVRGPRYGYDDLDGQLKRNPVQELAPDADVAEHITHQLNEPFTGAVEMPFRPFFKREGDRAYLGMVYRHWIADSHSIRLVMQEWFARLFDPSASLGRLEPPRQGYLKLFGPRTGGWGPMQTMLDSLRFASRARSARRVPTAQCSEFHSSCDLFELGEGLIDPLRDLAHRHGARLNDVFLACMAQACDECFPPRQTSRRRDLALGSIVDLRKYAPGNLDRTFGLFLGYTGVLCKSKDVREFDELLRSIAEQSKRNRHANDHAGSSVRMMVGLAAGRMFDRQQVIHFYRKRTPLIGGISNVNLNQTWAAKYHPAPLERYIRVSPTGPMLPAVFCVSSLGDRLDLSLTWRTALLNHEQATALAGSFRTRLLQAAGLTV